MTQLGRSISGWGILLKRIFKAEVGRMCCLRIWNQTGNRSDFCNLLTTYFTGQSSSCVANRFSDSQEILRISWNPKVHCLNYKCPLPIRIMSHINLFHAPIALSPEDPS